MSHLFMGGGERGRERERESGGREGEREGERGTMAKTYRDLKT